VNHLTSFLIICCIIFSAPTYASENKDWVLYANYLSGGKAEMDEPGRESEEIIFSQTEAKVSYTHRFDDESGLVFDLGHGSVEIDWDENPSFSEKSFSTFNVQVGGYSFKIPKWLWRGAIGTNVDTEEMDISHYALYNGTMWGRYSLSDMMGLHIGFTGTTGLRRDKVYPIFGIDYNPSSTWKLSFVFPVDMSANYSINDKWSVSATARTFRVRHRLSQKEALSKGIFDYRSFGSEFSLNYLLGGFLAKVYAGSTYAGDLKVSDSKGINSTFYKFNGSVYLGSNLTYKF
jgi:hypothetical protein